MKWSDFWVPGAEIWEKKRLLRVDEVKMGAFLLQTINFLQEKQKKNYLKIGQIGPLAVPLIMECTLVNQNCVKVTC